MRDCREIQPRYARNRAVVIRPPRLGLDPLHVAPFLHIPEDRRVKCTEIRAVFAPNVGKRVVVRMEDGIGRVALLIKAKHPVPVRHSEFLPAVDRPHDRVQHRRIEAQPVAAYPAAQAGHVQPHRYSVIGADYIGVIGKMLRTGPGVQVDRVKSHCRHLLSHMISQRRRKRKRPVAFCIPSSRRFLEKV